ncbi:MAG: hypothetical protein ACRC5M_01545, partial [Anaeroplasmataceae bacterium]
MKKLKLLAMTILISILLLFSKTIHANTATQTFAWTNTYITVPLYSSIFDYSNLPTAKLIRGGVVVDSPVTYLRGDNVNTLGSIDTHTVGKHLVKYTAICEGLESYVTITFHIVSIDNEAPI